MSGGRPRSTGYVEGEKATQRGRKDDKKYGKLAHCIKSMQVMTRPSCLFY